MHAPSAKLQGPFSHIAILNQTYDAFGDKQPRLVA